MLRMGYMPSDFHPILLVLGQAGELGLLSDLLNRFAESGSALSLTDAGIHSTDTMVLLSEIDLASNDTPGLWQSGDAPGNLVWRLPKTYASIFADDVADLASSGAVAGSATLECEIAGEIKVKVSIGEWEDHYLTGEFR